MAVGFAQLEAWRDEQLALEEVERHKLDRRIAREEDWLRYGVTARRKRNVRRVAELQNLRQVRRDLRRSAGKAVLGAPEASVSGALVIDAKAIGKTYAGRRIVQSLFDAHRPRRSHRHRWSQRQRQDHVGQSVDGELAPDSGSVRLGSNLQMVRLDQRRESLDPDWTLSDALTGGRGIRSRSMADRAMSLAI